jgi:hypothetical protein
VKVTPAAAPRKPPSFRLQVELLDVEVGAVGARLVQNCDGCSDAQAAELLSDLVRRSVLETASRPRGVLEVRSQPPGATVFVDGTELGITPYRRVAFVGSHKLVLRHTGYRSEQLSADVLDGQKQHVEVALHPGSEPLNVVVVERERTPLYRKWWFWAALGGAAATAAAVTTGVLLAQKTPAERELPPATYMFMF